MKESAPNTWMYGGILIDYEWKSPGGKAQLWNGEDAEVEPGDTVVMLWTGGVVHAVEVRRAGADA